MKMILACLLLTSFAFSAVSVGDDAKTFKLMNQEGKEVALDEFKGKTIVLEWTNHGCPFVKKHYNSGNMQKLQADYADKVIWLSIISSAQGKQGYSTSEQAKDDMKSKKSKAKYVLLDKDGTVGKNYGAKTTPHMYIIGEDFKVKYMGAIDSVASTDSDDIQGSTNYVKDALDSLIAKKEIKVAKTKPYGCSVKY